MGGGGAPARQGALTAAIAATPARFYHSRHCNTHQSVVCMQGSMPAHAGADMGMPVWELGRGAMQKEGWQCGQKPASKVA